MIEMLESLIFYPAAGLIIICSLMVILHKSPIRSALFLLASLFIMAILYATLSAHFVAVVQVLVYAGGIIVLILFAIMVLDLKKEKADTSSINLGFFTTLVLSFFLLFILFFILIKDYIRPDKPLPDDFGTIAEVGKLMITDYVFAFEAVSALVIATLVGSVFLTRGLIRRSSK